ncbi:MAG: MoxR family ATPase [Cellvibrionaceae bacterium]|nr:MoxR family ATPase [Cellvibrionaceae bacterium]
MHLAPLQQWMQQNIIGQPVLINRLLIALLADGHLLVEGPPGLAKTKAIKHLAEGIAGDFQRIQFTPDLLPTDITGTDIYRPDEHRFEFQPGPVFHNLVLADEINRAPAKTQAALLEAMAESQVSVGNKTYPLSQLFLVMATQNPLEQEGTYPLPEAQLDRFLMQVNIRYPDAEGEHSILQLARSEASVSTPTPDTILSVEDLLAAQQKVLTLYTTPSLDQYMVQLAIATRVDRTGTQPWAPWLECGVSPRATIALDRCAKAHAYLQGNDFVSPDNIHAVIHDVFRHRLVLSFEAEAEGISADTVIDTLLEHTAIV